MSEEYEELSEIDYILHPIAVDELLDQKGCNKEIVISFDGDGALTFAKIMDLS